MLYMLDTDTCSFIIREKPPHVRERLERVTEEGHIIGLSSIVIFELFYGAHEKGSRRLIEVIEAFVDFFEIYEFGFKEARTAGVVRAKLASKGYTIGAYDLLTGSHALSLGATLVTNNVAEFKNKKTEGLRVESWIS